MNSTTLLKYSFTTIRKFPKTTRVAKIISMFLKKGEKEDATIISAYEKILLQYRLKHLFTIASNLCKYLRGVDCDGTEITIRSENFSILLT